MTEALDTDVSVEESTEDLSYDEWDGLLITQWFEADPGAPVPASSREGEYKYAHENPNAWLYFGLPIPHSTALQILITEAKIQESRHLAGQHNQQAHAGKFATAELSDSKASELMDRLAEPDGGFTINPRDGSDVTSGYAVAAYKQRSKEIPIEEVSEVTLQSYVEANADLLSVSGNMFGGWHDPDTGHVWLDVSRVTSDKDEAISIAQLTNQIAIFDLDSGQSVSTGGTGRKQQLPEIRALSKVDRAVVRLGDNCPECIANNDPTRVPVHPGCDCEVMTDSVQFGVDAASFQPAEQWIRENGTLRFVQGNRGFPDSEAPEPVEPTLDNIRIESGSVTILDIQDARFSDVQKWLEQLQPLLEAGDTMVTIIVEEAESTVDLAQLAAGAETLQDFISGRLMLAVSKVVI
jgi:hypothetical protein